MIFSNFYFSRFFIFNASSQFFLSSTTANKYSLQPRFSDTKNFSVSDYYIFPNFKSSSKNFINVYSFDNIYPKLYAQNFFSYTFPICLFYNGIKVDYSWYLSLLTVSNFVDGKLLFAPVPLRFVVFFISFRFRHYYFFTKRLELNLYFTYINLMMITFNQLILRGRTRKSRKSISPRLNASPHKKAVCIKVYTIKPKKPNSAIRKIAKVKLSTGQKTLIYLPGQGHSLQQHSVVLVRGGRVPDSPGILYHAVRGKYDFTAKETFDRRTNRSKYGTPKPDKKK